MYYQVIDCLEFQTIIGINSIGFTGTRNSRSITLRGFICLVRIALKVPTDSKWAAVPTYKMSREWNHMGRRQTTCLNGYKLITYNFKRLFSIDGDGEMNIHL
jgi:hypothetical protein